MIVKDSSQTKEKPFSPVANQSISAKSLIGLIVTAVVVGLLLSFLISIIKVARMVDTRAIFLGLDGLRVWIGIGLVTLAAAIGLVLWLRPRLPVLLGSLLGVTLVVYGATRLVRVESFYGNMVPRLVWSWTPEAKEPYADYQLTQPVATEDVTAESYQVTENDFTGFLGPNRDGVIPDVQLNSDWQNNPPELLWQKPVGLGWAGFAVVGQLAVTQEQRGDLETVVAYDAVTGEEVWVHGDPVRFEDEHGDGPRGVPTYHNGRIYTMGATGLLNCLDISDGTLIWQQQTLQQPDENNLLWGMSGSPLVVDNLVVVTPGGGPGQAIKAYRVNDGRLVFAKGDDPAAYASPSFVNIAGQPQFLCFNGAGLRGFAKDGTPLWLYPWITQGEKQRVNVAQPLIVFPPDRENNERTSYVLVSSGYSMGIAMVAVSVDAEDQWTTETVWHSRALKSKMSNFVVRDGFIYGFDNGIFTCLDLRDGSRQWKRGRYGHGQVLMVGEQLLIQTETGEIALVAARPDEFIELATLPALADKTWNHASLSGKLLFVRNDREAACYRLP